MVDDAREVARPRIGDRLFTTAAKAMSSRKVVERLAAIGLDQGHVEELATLVRTTDRLVLERPDATRQAARDVFLDDVTSAVLAHGPTLDLRPLHRAIRTVRSAELGFHSILETLSRSEAARDEPEVRVAAAVECVEADLADLSARVSARLAEGSVTIQGGLMVDDGFGNLVSSDVVLTAFAGALRGILTMEVHANDWFDGQGRVALPTLPRVGSREVGLARIDAHLAMSWMRWDRFQRLARYLDEDIVVLTGPDLPADTPGNVTRVIVRSGAVFLDDWIANERAVDRSAVLNLHLSTTPGIPDRVRGIGGRVRPAPAEFVSVTEVTGGLLLKEALGYDLWSDEERPGGLRLLQWVRGFSALSSWAAERSASGGAGMLGTSEAELKELLTRLSLTGPEADTFLDAVSFRRTSRDLFDAPVVRTETAWFVVGPAVMAPRVERVVPSLLESMGISLTRKGHAFQDRVVGFLRTHGIDARTVRTSRAGIEYDFDVMAPWQGTLLVIECKNHVLSGNDPLQAHHFAGKVRDAVVQSRRLVAALSRCPDIVANEFGERCVTSEVIPIVLQNETFCVPGRVDGVYVHDWSSLSRFFMDPEVRAKRVDVDGGTGDEVVLASLWTGDAPTPADLIRHLGSPHQHAFVDHHRVTEEHPFLLSVDTWAFDVSSRRVPPTHGSMARALGAAFGGPRPEPVRDEASPP